MRLQDIMTTSVITISPDADIAEARETMKLHRIHHLVVTNGRAVVGVLSQRDLPRGKSNGAVGDAMAASAVTASPTTTVREAANLMRGRSIGCLPVAARGELVGIVTVTDLLELLGRGVERPIPNTVARVLKGRGPARAVKTRHLRKA